MPPEPCAVTPGALVPEEPELAILGAGFISLHLLGMLLSGFQIQCLD